MSRILIISKHLIFIWSVGTLQNERMPLHWAASGGHTDIVKYLLDHRVPIDEKDDVSVSSSPLELLNLRHHLNTLT